MSTFWTLTSSPGLGVSSSCGFCLCSHQHTWGNSTHWAFREGGGSLLKCQLPIWLQWLGSAGGHISGQHRLVRFSAVAQLCPALCDLRDCSMPGFSVLRYLPEFAQTHVQWVGDAIQPSHPLSPPAPPAFNLSQHQGLYQWVGFLHQVAQVLELQLQHQSFQWVFTVDFLWDWLVWPCCCPRDSQESFPTPQFKSINSLVLSLLHGPTLTSVHDYWKNHCFDYTDLCPQSSVSAF